MNKCHTNINWVNDTVPAINDTNLNYMDGCIDTIDTRVVSLDTAKLEAEDVANTITNMTLNGDTGVITCTRYNGSTFTIDTVLEKVVTNFTYDSATQSLVLTLADGSTVNIPLSDFITETEFIDSNTIAFNVSNHVVTAVVKNNSIGDAQMQTGYLTDCQTAKNAAELAATTSNTNRLKSEGYAVGKHDGIDVPSTDEAYSNNSLHYSQESNAWANGKKGNTDVPSTAPQYHNNAKYWADQARAIVGGEDNVKYTSQTKTEAEKTIARTNIGAISGRFDKDDTTWTSSTDLAFEDGYYEVKGINANYPYEDYFPVEWCDAIDDRVSAVRTHLIVQSDYLQNKWLTLISQDLGHWQEHGDNLDIIRVWMMYYNGNQDYTDWQVVSNLSDGGGLLPHVVITCETGSTITISKSGTTITATETSTGQYEADIAEYGTYTITATKNGQTATSTLVVDDVKIYNTSIGFFNATITVTYPSGATCVLSATGQASQTASGSPYTFTVHEATTYTITATLNGASRTQTVVITTDGQSETISFVVDGATITPVNDVATWLDCACLWNKNYTTLAQVIADSQTLLKLISTNNAVDYMKRSTTWASSVCADALAMLYIGEYNYCADALLSDSTWRTAICESEFFEYVLTDQVPIMTDDTHPSGEAFGSSTFGVSTWDYYYVFNKDYRGWYPERNVTQTGQYVGYKFEASKKIYSIVLKCEVLSSTVTIKFQASNDGTTWTDITSNISLPAVTTGSAIHKYTVNVDYQYYRLFVVSGPVSDGDRPGITVMSIALLSRSDTLAPSHTLKTFAAANDKEIAEMVFRADRGEIDLYNDAGWRVGQEHEITLLNIINIGTYDGVSWSVGEAQRTQTATLVLMHKGLYELVSAVASGRTNCSFVVGVKNTLSSKGYMNSSDTNTGSWNGCARRNWCNGGFRGAIPSDLRNVFKQFKTITAQTYNGSTNQTSQDYFTFAAEKEIIGSAVYGNTTEAAALTQFTWYETTANRIKTDDAYGYWMRGPAVADNTRFARGTNTGTSENGLASTTRGIAPFGCL